MRGALCGCVFRRFLAVLSRYRVRSLYNLPTMSKGKMVSPHFSALLTPGLLQLENTFKSAGYSLRLVGGVVRDLLLGRAPKDIDMATECKPKAMLNLLSRDGFKVIPTGMEHGTVTVIKDEVTYEVSKCTGRVLDHCRGCGGCKHAGSGCRWDVRL